MINPFQSRSFSKKSDKPYSPQMAESSKKSLLAKLATCPFKFLLIYIFRGYIFLGDALQLVRVNSMRATHCLSDGWYWMSV